jgi:hypothetical protein
MVMKVVISIMLASVAALAWQGLTSVPGVAYEETGSLITWGQDSVWGLFPDASNGQTHAGVPPLISGFWFLNSELSESGL